MSNASVLRSPPTDAGAYSGGAWRPPLPLLNLTSQDPQRVARSVNVNLASTQFSVDCGRPSLISQFALINHNMTTAGLVRLVLTDSPTNAGTPIYDSGWVPAWEQTVVWGSLPWGVFPWDLVDTTAYPAGAMLLHTIPKDAQGQVGRIARYVFVYLDDTTNPDGFLQIGRFLGGWAWSPKVNAAWGGNLRWVDPSEVKRTAGGRRIVKKRPKYRVLELSFEALTEADAMGTAETISRALGKSGELLICLDPDAPPAVRFRQTIYGALSDTSPIVAAGPDRWTWRLTVEEIN
ncbi:hypothetical protein [Teichococcus deserti]|uniref:hypothetical protein n=1 Tax=Teichococcus deserti TaxID=1817963 RepID=UPI001055323B|nr:hypothetical protein [Pseudoroseomonas deserti]